MIANFFNKSKPVNIIYLIVLLFVYFLINSLLIFQDQPFFDFLLKILGLFLVNVGILFLANFIVFKNKLIHNNYYPQLLVVLLLGMFPEVMLNANLVLSNLFLLLAFRKIFSLKSNINTKGKIFDSGFWIGMAMLFYSWSFLFLALVYVSIIVYKKTDFRNFIIPIIGFITPVFIYFTYLFYFDNLPIFYNHFNLEYSFNFEMYKSVKIVFPLLFLVIVLIWSILNVSSKFMLVNNVHKYSWVVVLWLLFISILMVVFSTIKNSSELLFVIFPSAIIIGNFIQKSESSLLKNSVLYIFLLFSFEVYLL